MKHKDVWNFSYKGINCEIQHWGVGSMCEGHGMWNSYIIINKNQLPKDFKKLLVKSFTNKMFSKRKFFRYDDLGQYFDFHGGITYYSKIRDEFDGSVFAIKVGCDYGHLWDEEAGYPYNETTIEKDLQKSVDVFIKHFPKYLVWNPKDGSYVKPKLLNLC